MKQLWHRIRTAVVPRQRESRPAEPEVAADPHQVTGRPQAPGGSDDQDPGTTGTGPSGGFVGRAGGDEAGEGPDGAEARAEGRPGEH